MAGDLGPIDTQILQKFALFNVLADDDRRTLLQRSHRRHHKPGERIFRFGDDGQSVLALLAGSIRVSRPLAKGKEIILGDLGPGEVIGEIAVLDGKQRSADAVALTKVELLVIDRREIIPFLEAHPKLCLRLLSLICTRLRHADERMTDIGFMDLRGRLAKTLLRNARPSSPAPGSPLKIGLSQTVLAEMIGGTRETVNRQLRAWQQDGLLKIDRGWIAIVDRDALAALVSIA